MRAAANRALSPLESSRAEGQNDKEITVRQNAIQKWAQGIVDNEINPECEKAIAKSEANIAKSEEVIRQLKQGTGLGEKLHKNYNKLECGIISDSKKKELIEENKVILAEMEKYPVYYNAWLYATIFESVVKLTFQQSIKDQICARFNAKSEQAEKVS